MPEIDTGKAFYKDFWASVTGACTLAIHFHPLPDCPTCHEHSGQVHCHLYGKHAHRHEGRWAARTIFQEK